MAEEACAGGNAAPPQNVLVQSSTANLYVSDNGGRAWRRVTQLDGNATRVIVAESGHVRFSAAWQRERVRAARGRLTPRGAHTHPHASCAPTSQVYVLGSARQHWHSSDYGATFEAFTAPANVYRSRGLALHGFNPRQIIYHAYHCADMADVTCYRRFDVRARIPGGAADRHRTAHG